ncbi:MAG: FAD-dependent oxidoreductase [Leptospiraceae bacterium]|nr:FAD-dependent oxidoreductase [Leptospiraceae bacterium]MCP5498674.1 FAD-dependent oxidoreductase [Leptospiraceae bacterium]
MIQTRKDFLKKAVIWGASGFAVSSLLSEEPPKKGETRKAKFCIIGAGLSGLYAAYKLQKQGHKVVLIEARKEAGGRIQTYFDEKSGFIGELGGEFIDKSHTLIQKLCTELGLELEKHRWQEFYSVGKEFLPFAENYLTKETTEIIKRLEDLYSGMNQKQLEGLDKISLYNYLKYQGIKGRDLLLVELKLRTLFGESITGISAARGLPRLLLWKGGQDYQFKIKGGSSQLVQKLEKEVGNENILKSESVVAIWQNNRGVEIITSTGKKIQASKCICTIPAHFLDKINWSPELPKDLKFAALQINYSRQSKVVSVMEDVIWLTEGFSLISTSSLNWMYILQEDVLQKKGLLTIVNSGDTSELFYNLSPKKAKKIIEFSASEYDIFKANKVSTFASRCWQYEPYIKGACSIYSPAAFSAREALRTAFRRVFFAGEHLGDDTGSMNSAIQSVDKILPSL